MADRSELDALLNAAELEARPSTHACSIETINAEKRNGAHPTLNTDFKLPPEIIQRINASMLKALGLNNHQVDG